MILILINTSSFKITLSTTVRSSYIEFHFLSQNLIPHSGSLYKYDNKDFCYWVSLLLKVEHISYTMGTHAYTCPWQVCI